VTFRAIAVALVCVVALSLVTPYIEFVILGTQIGAFAPPAGPVLFLLALVALNPLSRRLGLHLRRGELVTIYAVLLMVAVLPSCQFSQWIFTVVTGPFYFGRQSGWEQYTPLIPRWWGPRDPQVIRAFYEGLARGEHLSWASWITPLATWGPFILVFYLTIFCLCILLRRQWIDKERLSFPLVQLPLEMTRGGDFFRQRLMWFGAGIPIAIHTLNGLARYASSVPAIKLHPLDLAPFFRDWPWTMANPFFLSIFFSLIGFAFLLPRDVTLSMWFFYLVYRFEPVLGAALGWTTYGEARGLRDTSFPLIEAQSVGAVLTVVGLGLWAARPHLREMWRLARLGGRDPGAPLSPRGALIGLGAGMLLLSAWATAAGMPFWLAFLLFTLTLAFVIGVYRMMAEGGINLLWAAQSGPNYLLNAVGGGAAIGPGSWLVLLSLPYFIWNFKGPVGPMALEAFKLTDSAGVRMRRLAPTVVVAMGLAIVTSYWAVLYLVHAHGGGLALDTYRFEHVGERPFMELTSVVQQPEGFSAVKVLAMGAGAAFTAFLAAMRWRFLWFPFHPLGYASSTIWAANYMWFSMLCGWLANLLLTRFGGLRWYRQARPFFLGLILGDFLMLGLWACVNALTGVRGYYLFGF
jgi:hypothetical protein